LIDVATGHRSDPEISAHAKECPSCREQLQLVRGIASMVRPAEAVSEETVSEDLIQRTMEAIDFEQERKVEQRSSKVQGIWSAVLGAFTMLFLGLQTGGDASSPRVLLVCSMLLGLVSGVVTAKAGRGGIK
jgi:LSD1 subclass zinc finger protein